MVAFKDEKPGDVEAANAAERDAADAAADEADAAADSADAEADAGPEKSDERLAFERRMGLS